MSYLQDLGIDLRMTAVATQPLLKPPFPGAIWVPPSGGKAGYWKRPTTAKTVATVTQSYPPGTLGYFQQLCKKQGIDARNVAPCVRYLQQVKEGTPKKWEAAVKLYKAVPGKRPGDLDARQEHRPEACETAGLPPELVPHCKAALQSGLSLEQFIKQLEELSPEELEAVMGGAAVPGKSKILLYGGAAAAALVLLLILRKKK
jgi:hypothetical protein